MKGYQCSLDPFAWLMQRLYEWCVREGFLATSTWLRKQYRAVAPHGYTNSDIFPSIRSYWMSPRIWSSALPCPDTAIEHSTSSYVCWTPLGTNLPDTFGRNERILMSLLRGSQLKCVHNFLQLNVLQCKPLYTHVDRNWNTSTARIFFEQDERSMKNRVWYLA